MASQFLMTIMIAVIAATTAAIGARQAVKAAPNPPAAPIAPLIAPVTMLTTLMTADIPVATLPMMMSKGPSTPITRPTLRIMSFISGLRFFHHLANSFSLSEHFLIIGLKLSLMVFPTSLRASFILFEATLTSPLPSSRFLYVSVTESVESARINAESDTFLKSNEPFFNAS